MGNLPKSKVGTKTLILGGAEVEVRGLLRKEFTEALKPGMTEGATDADRERSDVITIAYACDVTEEEAAAWVAEAPAGHVIRVIEAVMDLSGLGDEAGKG